MGKMMDKHRRNPIAKIIVLIRTEQQKELLASKISNLPVDADHPIQVTISDQTKARGVDANGLMWKRITEISAQGWINKRQYSKDCWHKYLKDNEMPEEVELKDGTICSKWIEQIDGSREAISTTLLSAKCFSEYITIIEAFGSGLGVMFSANPREYEH
jgi:hypothetical protein